MYHFIKRMFRYIYPFTQKKSEEINLPSPTPSEPPIQFPHVMLFTWAELQEDNSIGIAKYIELQNTQLTEFVCQHVMQLSEKREIIIAHSPAKKPTHSANLLKALLETRDIQVSTIISVSLLDFEHRSDCSSELVYNALKEIVSDQYVVCITHENNIRSYAETLKKCNLASPPGGGITSDGKVIQ